VVNGLPGTVLEVGWCSVGRGDRWVEVVGPERGAPVLLVAGGGGAAWSWDDVIDEIDGAPVACRVARFDQAGVGRSCVVEPATSVDGIRTGLPGARTNGAGGEHFGGIGLSFDGATALRMAALAPPIVVAPGRVRVHRSVDLRGLGIIVERGGDPGSGPGGVAGV